MQESSVGVGFVGGRPRPSHHRSQVSPQANKKATVTDPQSYRHSSSMTQKPRPFTLVMYEKSKWEREREVQHSEGAERERDGCCAGRNWWEDLTHSLCLECRSSKLQFSLLPNHLSFLGLFYWVFLLPLSSPWVQWSHVKLPCRPLTSIPYLDVTVLYI